MNKQAIAIRKVVAQLERIAKALDDVEKSEPDPRQEMLFRGVTLIDVFTNKEEVKKQIMGIYI
jgi:chaperonin cofactor prefoldin